MSSVHVFFYLGQRYDEIDLVVRDQVFDEEQKNY